jgi:hypothetical protein
MLQARCVKASFDACGRYDPSARSTDQADLAVGDGQQRAGRAALARVAQELTSRLRGYGSCRVRASEGGLAVGGDTPDSTGLAAAFAW